MSADRGLATLAGLLLAAALPQSVEAARLSPRDECSTDPKLRAFLTQLRRVTMARDGKGLVALLAPTVQNDFGGGSGIADFRTRWQIDKGAASPVWAELDAMLKLGCAREKTYAAIPHMFVRFDAAARGDGGDADIDPFITNLAIGTGIVVRAEPRRDAGPVATLNWDIVTRAGESEDQSWIRIRTPNGREGYVSKQYLRSTADYRILIGTVRGQPRITTFISGD